jgi:excisionase family DNA binding protein
MTAVQAGCPSGSQLAPAHAEKALYGRKEAARYLGLAAQTLASWACSGRYQLPYVKLGRRVYYRRHDLDAFIEANLIR